MRPHYVIQIFNLLLGLLFLSVGASAQTYVAPVLLSPVKGDSLMVGTPVNFMWQYPGTQGVIFDFLIVEVIEGQSPEVAIQANPPLIQILGISTQNLLYPFSATTLIAGKTYAWQIGIRTTTDIPIQLFSEVSYFKIYEVVPKAITKEKPLKKRKQKNKKEEIRTMTDDPLPVYRIPKPRIDASSYQIRGGYLPFIYMEEYATDESSSMAYELIDPSREPRYFDAIFPIQFGENRLLLDISNLDEDSVKIYTLKITDQKGKVSYLRFQRLPD